MTATVETIEPPPPPDTVRRQRLAPLLWLGLGLGLALVELVAVWLMPTHPSEEHRAGLLLVGVGVLSAVILLSTALGFAVPAARAPRAHRFLAHADMVALGLATLAFHGIALWVIFARVHAPAHAFLKLDPILDAVLGHYVAIGWLGLQLVFVGAVRIRLLFLGEVAHRR